jgi:translation initiation factor 2 beta subunit (eIF-2beta)/eIF-5
MADFTEICDTMSRDQPPVFTAEQTDGAIKKYVNESVLCKACHLPGTKLIKDGGQTFIRREACGAKYPLR